MVKRYFFRLSYLLLLIALTSVGEVRAQQMTDLVITGISLPPDVVPQIQPIGVQFTIANNGDANATNFFCGIQIFSLENPSVPIFQNQVNVPLLTAGETQTLQSTQPWLPTEEGEYIVQVAAVYEFDNTPSNNVMGKSFRVGQSEQLLTLQQAVAILNEELLDNHPRADSLVALHISPPANPADSLIPPGLSIMAADSSLTLQ
ncbi:MAG: CARDB domain-containing protein, partial [Candidatus Kapaibacterium sp.]